MLSCEKLEIDFSDTSFKVEGTVGEVLGLSPKSYVDRWKLMLIYCFLLVWRVVFGLIHRW